MLMKKVMVINDSRFERLILRDMLNRLGYSVKDTDEFISMRQIDHYDPDIIVVNRTMYDISGLDLIDMIKTKNPKYKCYLSSCSPLHMNGIRASKADGAFQTPIGISELKSVMEGTQDYVGTFAIDEQPQEIDISSESGESASAANTATATLVAPAATAAAVTDSGQSGDGKGPETRFCPYCGGDIHHGVSYVFCPYCGKKLDV